MELEQQLLAVDRENRQAMIASKNGVGTAAQKQLPSLLTPSAKQKITNPYFASENPQIINVNISNFSVQFHSKWDYFQNHLRSTSTLQYNVIISDPQITSLPGHTVRPAKSSEATRSGATRM
ncbi:hypothetical protein TrLO_g3183 [Triparma laevis f. longispina]|nr:hypothetical protein TrLO_g3183 [Triparma laevis f. longispina]